AQRSSVGFRASKTLPASPRRNSREARRTPSLPPWAMGSAVSLPVERALPPVPVRLSRSILLSSRFCVEYSRLLRLSRFPRLRLRRADQRVRPLLDRVREFLQIFGDV